MKVTSWVKRGKEFLSHVSTDRIEQRLKEEPPGKSRERLQAAQMRRDGKSEGTICKILGHSKSTISAWLKRIEKDGLDAIHDGKSMGRPPKLSPCQQDAVRACLEEEPTYWGFERSNWTARVLAKFVKDVCGVQYSVSGILALSRRLGCSIRMPRPVPHNTADRETVNRYVSDTTTAIPLHVAAGYAVGCMDAAAFAKAPFSARGIRPIGGHETVQTSFSKATTKALGALMEDELVLNFCDNANSDSVMELLEKLRQKYGRIFIICDNARAHKSKKIQEYLGRMRGEVVLWYLFSYTPQHNPIEIVWRELKRAIAGRYFDKFKEMRKTIRRLIKSGEVATVKLLWYMLDAISRGKTLQKAAS